MRNARAGFFSFHFLLCKHGRVNQLLAQIHSFNVPYNNCVLQSCAFFLQKHVLFFRDIQRLRPDIFVLVLHLLSACSQLLFFSTASQKHYSCITYTDGSLKIRNDFQFYSFRFFFLLRLFLCDQSGGSFAMLIISPFYSLSVQFYLAHVVFGLPCYKPRERNFLYSFFFFFLFCRRPFGAATAAVDGTKREKNVLGFFFEEP